MNIIYKIFNSNRFFPFNFNNLNAVLMPLFSNGKNNLYTTNNMQNQCIMGKIKVLIEFNFPRSISN